VEPFRELSQFALDPDSIRRLGLHYCRRNNVVILGKVDPADGSPVTIGVIDPGAEALLAEVAAFLGRPVTPVRLNSYEIQKAIGLGFEVPPPREDTARLTLTPVRDMSFHPGSTVIDMLNEVLGQAVRLGASDLHLERYEDDVDVRLRIDGILHQVSTPISVENLGGLITRLKVLAGLDVADHRVAQDGRIRASYEEGGESRRIDFRLSVVPGPGGEDAVLRVLDNSTPVLGLERLGMDAATRACFEELIANPEGLVLVTGPTGSGKTTTLYSALDRLRSAERKVLTVEDPIEYVLAKTNQKQATEQMGFAAYARAFMRQNPDVILIGEVRDEETADVAIRAAQTGHLVLSTLHTNDSLRAVSRLQTLGVDAELIGESLLGSLSQRLARRLCPACRTQGPIPEEVRRRLPLDSGEKEAWCARGCDECRATGYRGRVGLYELFAVDDELADRIAAGVPLGEVRDAALARGMRTLLDDALAKAREGVTSLEEVLRVMPYRIIQAQRRRLASR